MASQSGDEVTWFKNLDGEMFWVGTDIDAETSSGATDVKLADIDGDGYLDVIAVFKFDGASS